MRAVDDPITIHLYYAAGYGHVGYSEYELGKLVYQKRLNAIEKRLHQLRRGCDEQF